MKDSAQKQKNHVHKKPLGLINKPEQAKKGKQSYERIAVYFKAEEH